MSSAEARPVIIAEATRRLAMNNPASRINFSRFSIAYAVLLKPYR